MGLLVVLAYLFWATVLRADSGERPGMAPVGKDLATTPYIIVVDARWCDVNGYRPVRVEVRRRASTTSLDERVVSVQMSPGIYGNRDSQFSMEQEVTIPEGAMSGHATFYIEQDQACRILDVTVSEGGRPIKQLRSQVLMVDSNYGGRNPHDGQPAVMVLDYDAPPLANRAAYIARLRADVDAGKVEPTFTLPDLRRLVAAMPGDYSYSGAVYSDVRILEELSSWSRMLILAPADLGDSWLSLTGIDLLFVSWVDLQRLIAEDPDKWQLVQNWLLAGGNLVTFGVGNTYEQLPDVEAALDLTAQTIDDNSDAMYRGWDTPLLSMYGRPVNLFDRSRRAMSQYYGIATPVDESATDTSIAGVTREQRERIASQPVPFVLRDVGLGTIVVFGGDPFPGDTQQWNWFFNTLTPERWLWFHRHGLSLHRENAGFWEFMIPNVGLAPVNAFRVLITLFVIVIGPVNYFVLKRAKRIGWMMVTVPVGASAVILSLFLYALITDGLGVQYRVRSLSHIDQRREHVVSWSRQAYYAGLTPSRGLSYPLDAAVYAIDQMPDMYYGNVKPRRHVVWGNDQNLRSGFIEPRVTLQLLVVRSRESKRGLQITGDVPGRPPRVVNRLGTAVQQLYVCDEQGELYRASNVAEGDVAKFSAVEAKQLRQEFEKYFGSAPLRRPAAFDEQSYRDTVQMNQNYYSYYSADSDIDPAHPTTSILERELSVIRLAWPAESSRKSYVAIVARDPEVPLGVPSGTPRISISVIRGEY